MPESGVWRNPSDNSELQEKVYKVLVAPVNLPQILLVRHLADFVTDPLGNCGRFRIIENNARLVVEPAIVLVDLGDDGPEAKR